MEVFFVAGAGQKRTFDCNFLKMGQARQMGRVGLFKPKLILLSFL